MRHQSRAANRRSGQDDEHRHRRDRRRVRTKGGLLGVMVVGEPSQSGNQCGEHLACDRRGPLSRSDVNSRCEATRSAIGEVEVTVALRSPPSRSEISP